MSYNFLYKFRREISKHPMFFTSLQYGPSYSHCPNCREHIFITTDSSELREGDILEITCDKCNHIWIDKFKLS